MSTACAIEMRNITKRFGPVNANVHVGLTVNRGEILALLGENGSGENDADEYAFRDLLPR